MSRLLRTLVCFCVLTCLLSEAKRILGVFPFPSISHQVAFRPLTHELARRGHEVVVITTDPAFTKGHTPANLTEIDVHDISYGKWKKLSMASQYGNQNDFTKQVKISSEAFIKVFEEQTAVAEVKAIIENEKYTFDLLMFEALTHSALGFSHIVKGPAIAISSCYANFDHYDILGAPTHFFLYPRVMPTRFYNSSLWEKFTQLFNNYSIMNNYKMAVAYVNIVMKRRFGDNTPDLNELKNNIDLLLLNIHPLWEGIRPVPPGVVHYNGVHQKPEQDLPQDLKQYLDASVHGVIYLSFGTNVDMAGLPADKVQTFINVFSQLPYDVLWKWDKDELPGRTKNIKISKWFPQPDLLRHPKIKLFVTQGGLQSVDETITAGVPLVVLPMLSDQYSNAERCERHKIGLTLNINDLNEENLKSVIKHVIEDESYRENVARLRTLMYDKPQSSLELSTFWAEHALRNAHRLRYLRAPAANMGWTQYYELELILMAIFCVSALFVLLYVIAKLTFKRVVLFFRRF